MESRIKKNKKNQDCKTAISLFCSGGIGDLAAHALGIDILVANELLPDRIELLRRNFPNTLAIQGDIWEFADEIVSQTQERLNGNDLDFIFATPPCQGMSSNGQGKLLNGIRKGTKPKFDTRNQLIVPTMKIICKLRPKTIVFENVPGMENTLIEDPSGGLVRILDFIERELGKDYQGIWEVVEFANYGVPQRRQRLITVFSREPVVKAFMDLHKSVLPPQTHSETGKSGTHRWVSVRDTIKEFPPLDAGSSDSAKSDIPFHCVPLLDKKKYFWVSNTPAECGAFDNQCVECGYDKNPTHGTARDHKGVNRAKNDTPIRCARCNSLLPRPWVQEGDEFRLMSGFTSAYKRMSWDKPASTLTRNLSYACSDHKLHPDQHRVLSLFEAFHLHTIADFEYHWEREDGRPVSDKTVRDVIGESIPPRGLQIIYGFLLEILRDSKIAEAKVQKASKKPNQPLLFSALDN
jgi:DNA (cytosine-5)-methyltransferase 1